MEDMQWAGSSRYGVLTDSVGLGSDLVARNGEIFQHCVHHIIAWLGNYAQSILMCCLLQSMVIYISTMQFI
jgi:hypothetical protein